MTQGNLGRWIEELDASLEKLQRRVDKISAGGGFDPSAYVYAAPFFDLSEDRTVIDYSVDDQNATYTATFDCCIYMSILIAEAPTTTTVTISDGTNTRTFWHGTRTSGDPTWTDDVVFLKSGQTITITHPDTISDSGEPAFYIWKLQQAPLQEAPVGLLGMIAKKVKKVFKGGE